MFRMLLPYKKGVDTQMQVVIGHTDIPLTKAQPESTLGNFMADAQLMAARVLDPKVEVSVSNYGGIRVPYIEAGPLTRGKIFELMPFDNMLIILELPGTILKQFCDHMAMSRGWPKAAVGSGLFLLGGFPFNSLAAAPLKKLTILHTNDVHSRLEPFGADGEQPDAAIDKTTTADKPASNSFRLNLFIFNCIF
ncbi:hypothetical protein OSTOST_12150 [Ostertagia ostertagi]